MTSEGDIYLVITMQVVKVGRERVRTVLTLFSYSPFTLFCCPPPHPSTPLPHTHTSTHTHPHHSLHPPFIHLLFIHLPFIHRLLQMVENSVKRGLATSPFARRKRSVMEDLYVRLRCCMFDYMHRSKRFEFGYSHSVSALTRIFLSILYLSLSSSPLASRPPTVSFYLCLSLSPSIFLSGTLRFLSTRRRAAWSVLWCAYWHRTCNTVP